MNTSRWRLLHHNTGELQIPSTNIGDVYEDTYSPMVIDGVCSHKDEPKFSLSALQDVIMYWLQPSTVYIEKTKGLLTELNIKNYPVNIFYVQISKKTPILLLKIQIVQ